MMPTTDNAVSKPQPEAPTGARRRLRIAPIAVVLVAGAGASWLYISEVTENLTMPRVTRAGDNWVQLKQSLQEKDDKGEKPNPKLTTVPTPTAQDLTETVHRLVLQVNTNEPATMNLALNNATNVEQYYKTLGEKVEIEVITFGPGLHMLRDDTSPVKDRIKAIAEKTPSITFKACGNTQENMGKAENKTIPLLAQATLVKSGVVRVMELQEQGWTYVRP
jgi:intracellular sulfur oxidation DsrE/DsrF family protein